MRMWWLLAAVAVAGQEPAKDEDVVFRSDTTLVRVDVQVLDQDNRAVTRLDKEAFILREQGQVRAIKNFVREEMPIDLLFLIDVSGSMRPHVERMAEAAHQSLPSLREEDRVAVMVFDRQARLRMPFRPGSAEGRRELDNLLRSERFNGGTDITRAMYEAAKFLKKQGRKEARRAVVLLTDDQTEFEADPYGVGRALNDADTVLSALLVPAVMPRGMGRRPGGWGRGGVTIGVPGIPGIPGAGGGRRGPVGMNGPRLSSAASAEIAQDSGGDSLPADSAAALDTTLNRIRQRYALYFNLPAGVREGDEWRINVALEATVKQRFPLAEVRYRKTYVAAASAGAGAPEEETLEVVPMRPAKPAEEKVITRKRTVDGSSSRGPSIVVH